MPAGNERPLIRFYGAALVVAVLLMCPELAWTQTVEFDESFLRSPVDISMFAQGTAMSEGELRVDVTINDAWKGRYRLTFRAPASGTGGAQPCYDAALLESLGFDATAYADDLQKALPGKLVCQALGTIVPGAQAVFDSGQLRLDITVPQMLLTRRARGYVDPARWEDGVTAAMLQYDYLGYHSSNTASGESAGDTSHYLGLRAGANHGKWRLRYRGAINVGGGRGSTYQPIAAYAERGIANWHSRLTVGDAMTDGQVFNSLGFRGVQLASDDRMVPDSQRGFAPVVQGIANSNARVTVTQQGNLIYETTVPPGPFIIDDLYPTGAGGDLRVTVTEADGSARTFSVAYAAMPELLRPGATRYSVVAGQYRNRMVDDAPALFSGTLRHGFSNVVTGYGGAIAAQHYQAVAGGVALNTPIGAISSDITRARSDLGGAGRHDGHSLRLGYSKNLPSTQTNVALAAYRYSRSGFYDANDAFLLREASGGDAEWQTRALINRRNRLQLGLSQALPGAWGTLGANASRQDYWSGGADTEFQVQYNNRFGQVNYGISAGRSRQLESGQWNNQVMLTFSVPLGSGPHAPNFSSTFSRDRYAHGAQTALSGTAGDANQFGYNVFASSVQGRPGPRVSTGGASAAWSAPFANIGASASTGKDSRQFSASASGGVVAYAGGVVFGPMLGETAALIEAPGAQGARVTNYSGVRLDHKGRAIVPYLSPYRQNTVEIDPQGISTDVAVHETSRNLAPTAGAMALVRFETATGHSVLMTLTDASDKALPFGAVVSDPDGQTLGYVAQGGQALVRLPAETGELHIKWGVAADDTCWVRYDLADGGPRQTAGFRDLRARCTSQEAVNHARQ